MFIAWFKWNRNTFISLKLFVIHQRKWYTNGNQLWMKNIKSWIHEIYMFVHSQFANNAKFRIHHFVFVMEIRWKRIAHGLVFKLVCKTKKNKNRNSIRNCLLILASNHFQSGPDLGSLYTSKPSERIYNKTIIRNINFDANFIKKNLNARSNTTIWKMGIGNTWVLHVVERLGLVCNLSCVCVCV